MLYIIMIQNTVGIYKTFIIYIYSYATKNTIRININ